MLQIGRLIAILTFLLTSTRGYRLRPWASPYLRWRIETYSGQPAGTISAADFWRFVWLRRRELKRFLLWTGEMATQPRQPREPRAGR